MFCIAPREVGPGKYFNKSLGAPFTQRKVNKPSMNMHFGQETRFGDNKTISPGPGVYAFDSNKWNKRTYNLKFLDINKKDKSGSKERNSIEF